MDQLLLPFVRANTATADVILRYAQRNGRHVFALPSYRPHTTQENRLPAQSLLGQQSTRSLRNSCHHCSRLMSGK